MKKISFFKYEAAGNDFILIDKRSRKIAQRLSGVARRVCNRTRGIGADGLLVIERSRKADIRMRIFNADGSEAEMCGNGIRCVGVWANGPGKTTKGGMVTVEALAGVLVLTIKKSSVKVRMSDPVGFKKAVSVNVNKKKAKVSFINTGVPHVCVFFKNITKTDVRTIGRQIRYDKAFQPAGTNVNFVQPLSKTKIALRTYERGIDGETFACGTGACASAVLSVLLGKLPKSEKNKISVLTVGGDILTIYFKIEADTVGDVYMEGPAKLVFRGEILV